ncbi:transcriptional repressor LexA [Flavobacterium sp. MXW15]|uniref:LexA repressor n=1 Tax=Xanthomonas chitinilytica TaxID=2989819 RepID=A0ABT3JYJ2_9XANT|nr:transcriptional repressor LexA [Xanthomonas sp. H13-6]MCW4455388.1 transcriptional repressor LexA [Flavobacterium sp. MXW15]MCW4473530.1 transcriptional repressor LexA [Xanthomonas sp. H13-6]
MSELSPRRAAILDFIRDRVAGHGQPPTLAEIADACGLASRGAARKHVLALAGAGLIEVAAGQARGIRPAGLRPRGDLLQVPVLGRVAAGVPIGADAGLVDTLALDARLFSARPDYLLRVQGDSMIGDGILEGDLVGVRRTPEARDGQTVVARLDGELTIKRLSHSADALRLLSRNPAYAPIEVQPGQDFAIEGVFCGLVRRG